MHRKERARQARVGDPEIPKLDDFDLLDIVMHREDKAVLQEIAAKEIARQAHVGVPEILGLDDSDLLEIAHRVTVQDSWWKSKRVHAAGAAALVLVSGAFGIDWDEAQLIELFGAAAALASAVLPLVSKAQDIRATRL